jgi:hypothetical protein
MGDQNVLSRASPCFGRHFKPLALTPVSMRVDVRQAAGHKTRDENMLYRPHLVWEKGREKKNTYTYIHTYTYHSRFIPKGVAETCKCNSLKSLFKCITHFIIEFALFLYTKRSKTAVTLPNVFLSLLQR